MSTTWETSSSSREVVQDYLLWLREARNRSPETLRTYTGLLEQWLDFLGPHTDVLLDVDPQTMERFTLRKRKGVGGRGPRSRTPSAATRKKEVSTLRSFYTWAWEQGRVANSPARALHAPTVHNTNPKPIPDEVWVDLWARDLTDGERLMLGLGFYLGMRREEIARLRGHNVTTQNVRDFIRKGGGEHTLPWAEMLAVYQAKLPHLVGDPESFLRPMRWAARQGEHHVLPWQTHDDPQSVNKRLSSLLVRLDVEPFTPHQLRHSAATNLLRAGVPLHLVSRLMNHANPQTTMRYVRAGGHELREWLGGL